MAGRFSYSTFSFGLMAWLSSPVDGFVPPSRPQCSLQASSPSCHQAKQILQSSSVLFQSESSDDAPSRRKKRVKRKQSDGTAIDGEENDFAAPPVSAPASRVDLRPREDTAVSLQVQDVRDLVAGGRASSFSTASTSTRKKSDATLPSISSQGSSGAAGDMEDAMQMLLKDARDMQSLEQKDARSESAEGDLSIPGVIRKVVSTIVTVDFFVVCGFLFWFLAGIFCSYVIKDDTVQIAFNQLFQPVVQPALGILMIGAIAGSVFGKEDEEDQI